MYAWAAVIGMAAYVMEMEMEEGRDGREKEDKV